MCKLIKALQSAGDFTDLHIWLVRKLIDRSRKRTRLPVVCYKGKLDALP